MAEDPMLRDRFLAYLDEQIAALGAEKVALERELAERTDTLAALERTRAHVLRRASGESPPAAEAAAAARQDGRGSGQPEQEPALSQEPDQEDEHTPPSAVAPKPMSVWWRTLEGLTQLQALIRIAEENGGVLVIAEAKEILLGTRLAKGDPQNVRPHIYHLVRASDRFEKLAPGRFRLLPVGKPLASGSLALSPAQSA